MLRAELAAAREHEERIHEALRVVRAVAARAAAYPGGADKGFAALPEYELQRLAAANEVLEAAHAEGRLLESGEEDWEEDCGSDAEASGDEAYDSDVAAAGSGDEAAGSDVEASGSGDEAGGSGEEYGSDPEAYGSGDEAYGSGAEAYGSGGEWADADGGSDFLDGLGAGSRRAWYEAGFRPAGSGLHRQLLLTGETGTGKSVALAALAHYMRALGAVVLYLPAAQQLTGGGFFSKSKAHPGMWDTAESAKLILSNLVAAHRAALEQLPARFSGEAVTDSDPGLGPDPDSGAAPHAPASGTPAAARPADESPARESGPKGRATQGGPPGGAQAGSEPGKEQGPTVAQVRPTSDLRRGKCCWVIGDVMHTKL